MLPNSNQSVRSKLFLSFLFCYRYNTFKPNKECNLLFRSCYLHDLSTFPFPLPFLQPNSTLHGGAAGSFWVFMVAILVLRCLPVTKHVFKQHSVLWNSPENLSVQGLVRALCELFTLLASDYRIMKALCWGGGCAVDYLDPLLWGLLLLRCYHIWNRPI